MTDSVLIYTLSNQVAEKNPALSNSCKFLRNLTGLISVLKEKGSKPNAIIFETEQLKDIVKLAQVKNITSVYRFVCIGDNLGVDQRLLLLNNNIEFISNAKFSELTPNYFTLGLGPVRKKVLFVDDDENQIEITEHILNKAGLDVKSITKGEDVLDTLNEYNPDLLLLDLHLDDITGDKLVKIIRKVPKHRFLPIVFLSADTTSESRMLVLNAGADDLINKPIESNLLVAAINNRIQRSLFNQFYQYENNPEGVSHTVEMQVSDLKGFLQSNSENPNASVLWFKVANKIDIQKKVGYAGFNSLCNTLINTIPGFQSDFVIKNKLSEGVFVVASENLAKNEALKVAAEICKWTDNNYFTINNTNIIFKITSIVLADIPSKQDQNSLQDKAESLLIDPPESQKTITLLEEGLEEAQFYSIKSELERMIKTRDIGWKLFPIVSTQDKKEVVYQMILDVNSGLGRHFKTIDFIEVAEKTGLLKVIDRFAIERSVRMIRVSELKGIKTRILLNQKISHYTKDLSVNDDSLEIYEGIRLPESSFFIQFQLKDALNNMNILGSLAQKIKKHNIKICLADFDYSEIAWKAARKLNASWIRILPAKIENKQLFDESNPNNLQHTIRKAHVLGFKVMTHNVNNKELAENLLNSKMDYMQGNYIKTPIAISKEQ